MKFRKVFEPAHTVYYVTVVRTNGERMECYNNTWYRRRREAEKEAAAIRARNGARNVIVESKDRPAAHVMRGTLYL